MSSTTAVASSTYVITTEANVGIVCGADACISSTMVLSVGIDCSGIGVRSVIVTVAPSAVASK